MANGDIKRMGQLFLSNYAQNVKSTKDAPHYNYTPVFVFKDTLALPSIDTLPVTEPVKVKVLEFAHFEDVEADPALSAFVA